MDLTIVIPHRGLDLGLWATVHSCDEDLARTGLTYNYVIITNGQEVSTEGKRVIEFIEKSGHLAKHIHSDEPMSPPNARQAGVEASDGDLLFFFDNHCLVSSRYFERAVMDMRRGDIDLLHSATTFYTGEGIHYHYRLTLEYNFWGGASPTPPPDPVKPYQIAMSGHGGFVVSRRVWDELGGYGPQDLLVGYGGEEPLFDLKAWRYGKKNWLDPKLIHYHYTGERGYKRHYTDEYYTNMLAVANVIGGEAWMYKVFDSFLNKSHIRPISPNQKSPYELLQIAGDRSAAYAAKVDSNSKYTLDQLLEMFKTEQVAH